MMNFYMTPGSCSTGIHILLEELELIFSANVVNLIAGDQQKQDFLRINPKGTIPVLTVAEDTHLTDFTSIALWLAMTHPKAKLLPESNLALAQTLELLNFITGHIHMQGFARVFIPERFANEHLNEDAIKAEGKAIALKGLTRINEYLNNDSGYLFDGFTIADAALFYVEFWASRIDMALPDKCLAHLHLMQSRPVVRRVLAEEGYRV